MNLHCPEGKKTCSEEKKGKVKGIKKASPLTSTCPKELQSRQSRMLLSQAGSP